MIKASSLRGGVYPQGARLVDQLAAIEEGIRAADEGLVVGHRRVAAWVASWATPNEKAMPLARESGEG
jgi:hypothetical protein